MLLSRHTVCHAAKKKTEQAYMYSVIIIKLLTWIPFLKCLFVACLAVQVPACQIPDLK